MTINTGGYIAFDSISNVQNIILCCLLSGVKSNCNSTFPLKNHHCRFLICRWTRSRKVCGVKLSPHTFVCIHKCLSESALDKMKRKMKLGGKHKQAEDTMSIASGMSVMSMTSTRGKGFMHKINKTLGGLHKWALSLMWQCFKWIHRKVVLLYQYFSRSSTLPPSAVSMSNAFDEIQEHDDYDAPHYLSPPSMRQHDRFVD